MKVAVVIAALALAGVAAWLWLRPITANGHDCGSIVSPEDDYEFGLAEIGCAVERQQAHDVALPVTVAAGAGVVGAGWYLGRGPSAG